MMHLLANLLLATAGIVPSPENSSGLAEMIAAILARPEYQGCSWGISARRVSANESLYQYSESTYFTPASNLKLLACFAAWLDLGRTYTYITSFAVKISPEGSKANFTLCGENDPSLTSAQVSHTCIKNQSSTYSC
jgi:D-alanyl-D-alanine carboxypeptidase